MATVARAEVDAFNAAIWCPLKAHSANDALLEGGGKFGPQCVLPPFLPSPLTPHPHLLSFMIRDYMCLPGHGRYAFSHNPAEKYVGLFPYTEYIEVAVEDPVYIFGLVFGLPRGAGAIVGIRAKKGDEWVRMYEDKPLISMNRDQKDNGGQYWRWSPPICRTHFKTDTIRIEMDTVAIADWNYIDYVEVLGSETIQDSALKHNSWMFDELSKSLTQSVHILYVPHENAHGRDSFEYQANDCPGDIFRSSESGVVSFEIAPVNDAPTLRQREVNITAREEKVLDFGGSSRHAAQHLLDDVETPLVNLTVELTRLPNVGTFHDGDVLIDRAQLPCDSMAKTHPPAGGMAPLVAAYPGNRASPVRV